MVAAVLAALLVVAVVVSLVYPLFRPPLEPVGEPAGPAARLAALESRKAAIYGSIRDLGQDLQTDKLTAEDYKREADTLKAQAVEVLARIEQLRKELPRGEDRIEEEIARIRDSLEGAAEEREPAESQARFCTSCGARLETEDRFCAACGEPAKGRS